ncbi:MAG: alpha/beta fold hydrolase [Treponema sp.]|nr:alpha/beta fold hydrolase [Treponema sp.]
MKEKICVKKFSCERDSLRIQGWMYFPKKAGGEKLKPVIISHGFMANHKMCRSYAENFARWGYAAFIFDFCGGCVIGKSEGKSTEMSVLTETEDLHSVVRYVQSLDFVNASELVLMGCSQGGFVSALLAARLQEQVKKLILFYPALCLNDDARRGKMVFAKFDPSDIPDVIQCGPMKLGKCYVEAVINMDIMKEISSYRGPVCIIHGDGDSLVKLEYSEKAIAAYRDVEKKNGTGDKGLLKKQLFVLQGAGHGFNKIADYHAMNIVEQFLGGFSEIMQICVRITSRSVEKENGLKVERAKFAGNAEGPFFSGKIQEGAEDVQKWKGRKPVSLSSDYVIKGPDSSGERKKISVSNFSEDGKIWRRTVTTDSKALRDFGIETQCEMVMEYRKDGPFIRVFTKMPL